jgi:cyclopropane fatty-acyl-phospholipid synthase-like methyltransferase
MKTSINTANLVFQTRLLRFLSFLLFLAFTVHLAKAQSPEKKLDVPYVPTSSEVVEAMLDMAQVTKNDVVYDLGCGDGRIVITAAKKYGATAVGVDKDPERIEEANANARREGVTDQVKFIEQNLFEVDFSEANVVTLYLLPSVNLKLRPKLLETLKPGTRIVSHAFTMGDWEPEKQVDIGGTTIYFWTVP